MANCSAEFLGGRSVPIAEMAAEADLVDHLPHLKKEMMTDREFLEKVRKV